MMLRDRVSNRLGLMLVLLLVVVILSACYKDAGEDVQPTSGQVNLTDIAPTNTMAPPTATETETLVPPVETATRTLVPTTTPADLPTAVPTMIPTSVPTEVEIVVPTSTPTVSALVTNTPEVEAATPTQFVMSVATASTGPTPTQILITTPGMSDILPSATPIPTMDMTNPPTPTAIPIEENPCIHVVSPSDTLYSIAQDGGVLLSDLVAANPEYLGGSSSTILQLGWQLAIPGCELPGQESAAEEVAGEDAADETSSDAAIVVDTAAGGTVTHAVQAGEGLYAIARQYGVEVQAIIDANGITNPNLIYPGDELIIPVGQ